MATVGTAGAPIVRIPSPSGLGPYCENCGSNAEPYARPAAALLCESCRRRHALIATAHQMLSWAALALIVWYGMPRLIAAQVGYQPVSQPGSIYLAFYGGLFVGLCLHEGAHAVCARVFHFVVPSVRIGSGPVVFRARIAGTQITFHVIPFSGLTSWRPGLSDVTTARRATIAAAGPIANLCLAAIAWPLRTQLPDVAIPIACGNLLLFTQNVLPRPPRNANDTPNDGWQILKNVVASHWARTHLRRLELTARCGAFTGPERNQLAAAYLRSEIAGRGGDDPDAEAMLCGYLLDTGADSQQIKEGFERSSRLLHDRRAFPVARATALNGRAYMLAVGGWPHLMDEAEWAARESMRFLPGNPHVAGTLGLVLVRQGRFDEAEAWINGVIAHQAKGLASAGSSQTGLARSLAANRCALGLLYAQTNRRDEAAHEFAQARTLDSSCSLLAELERVATEATG